jgi:hypothetical protein
MPKKWEGNARYEESLVETHQSAKLPRESARLLTDSSIVLIEPVEASYELTALHDPSLSLPQFNHEFSESGAVIVCQLGRTNGMEIASVILSQIDRGHNIGALQIFEGSNLLFLAGDQFDNECISFLAVGRNEKLVNELVREGFAILILQSNEE